MGLGEPQRTTGIAKGLYMCRGYFNFFYYLHIYLDLSPFEEILYNLILGDWYYQKKKKKRLAEISA